MIYNYHDRLVLHYSEIPQNDRKKDRAEHLEEFLAERPELTMQKETTMHCTNKS